MEYKRKSIIAIFAVCAMVVMSADVYAGSCGATPRNSQSVSSCPFTAEQGDILLDFTGDRVGNTSNDFSKRDTDTHLWSYSSSMCGKGMSNKSSHDINIAAGEYKVHMYTYDGYTGRYDNTQTEERAKVEFYQNGSYVAATGASQDLANGTKAEWQGQIGSVNLPNGASMANLRHASSVTSTPNSLSIGCVLIESVSQCGNGIIESGERCDDGNTNGGDGCSATCQNEPANGACGNADGGVFTEKPASGLCSSGRAKSTGGIWGWNCVGQNGGADATCSATQSSPSCGSADGRVNLHDSPRETTRCENGSSVDFSGAGTKTDPFTWKCALGDQTSNLCTARMQGPTTGPACNSNGLETRPVGSEACTRGAVTDPPGIAGDGTSETPWTWTCSHNDQVSQSCSATKRVPQGEVSCGADHGETLLGRQPTNLCGFGVASSVSQVENDWQWTCSQGSRIVQCHAQAQCGDGEIECNGTCQKMTIQGAVQTGFDAQGNPIPVHVQLDTGTCRPPAGEVECTVNGRSYSIEELIDDGIDYEVTHNDAGDVVSITCDGVTVTHKIACVCTARKCSAGGACVATPVISSSSSSGKCVSECTTNADCSGGSIGEVKP